MIFFACIIGAARHAKEMKECAGRISALRGKLIDIQSDKN